MSGRIFILSLFSLITLSFSSNTLAQCAADSLRIEVIAAPNLIDDSNVQTPAGVRVTGAHFGARFYNASSDTLVNVYAYIGTYTGSGGTPGIYPSKTHTGLTGTFSFQHSANVGDATRFIDTLYPGQYKVQYWLVEYPNVDDNGKAVYNACSDETDDLSLDYDIWASFADDEFPGTLCYKNVSKTATIRCEITAAANKIWPQGDNKVPSEWVDALNQVGYELGWDLPTNAAPGDVGLVSGTWYDLGNVNQGFDNDGDFSPDYNAWMQPVGDPSKFNADCFRLVKTYGLLLIKTNDQGVVIRPFEDQLYFQNLPPSNTGVVGYVRYEFMALNGPCSGQLTPYHEVASGRNNEKFNADFGTGGEISSAGPQASIEKSVDSVRINFPPDPHTLTYTVKVKNDGSTEMGRPEASVPVVISDAIPTGTTYKSGSASVTSGSYSFSILYSTNNGSTWTNTEPSPVSSITNIQWWFQNRLQPNDSVTVQYEIQVPASYPVTNGPFVLNTAYLSIGNNLPFDNDDAITFLNGTNTIGDTVFVDNGTGGGVAGDGIQNGTEGPIADVLIRLYYDRDSNGIISADDVFFDSVRTNSSGKYLFNNIPNGNWLVQVQRSDVTEDPNYTGYNLSSQAVYGVELSGNESYLEADFGFAPALIIEKTLISEDTVAESGLAVFQIRLKNSLYNPDYVDTIHTFWMTQLDSGATEWTNPSNALGAEGPDGAFTTDQWSNGKSTIEPLWTSGGIFRQPGNIEKVELLDYMYTTGTFNNDSLVFSAFVGSQEIRNAYDGTALNSYNGSGNAGLLINDITAKKTSWTWDEVLNLQRRITQSRVSNFDDIHVYVDAMGIRVETDAEYVPSKSNLTLSQIPLVDSFDVTEFEFVEATPNPNLVDEANGKIYWNHIGDLNPGESTTVEVILKPKEPTNNYDVFRNSTWVKDAKFFDGSDANEGESFADVQVEFRSTLSGFLWSDECNGSSGAYNSGTDGLLANVRISLLVCVNSTTDEILWPAPAPTKVCTSSTGNPKNDGKWLAIDTVVTNEQGAYLFEGLLPGYYYAQVFTADMVGASQTFDPDGTSDNRWGNPNANLNTFNTIVLNENEQNKNFGYTVNPIVRGYVYEKIGSDSFPAQGVTIYTSPASSQSITDEFGAYEIKGLTANQNYSLLYTTPSGATWTNIYSPSTQNLCTGEIAVDQNFAFSRSGTSNIGDTLFYDFNGNGVRNGNEEGIAGIKVYIIRDINGNGVYNPGIDIAIDSQITNTHGYYLSASLPSGEYLVTVDTEDPDWPSQWGWTADPDENGVCLICNGVGLSTLDGVNDDLTLDFGVRLEGNGSIGELVWIDLNNDNQKSSLEAGIDSVLVTLSIDLNNDGIYVPFRTQYTSSTGYYLFSDLPDGKYRASISLADIHLPSGYFNTNTNSYDLLINNGVTNNTTTSCSNCPTSANFAFNTYGSIGNFVYWDVDGNGSQDLNDKGIANVKVYLLDSLGVKIDSMLTADGTGANPAGYYLFSDLAPAKYTVLVDATDPDLRGGSQTADPNSDGLACSDPNLSSLGYPTCDHKYTTTLYMGENDLSADFGYDPPGSFGDYVWRDSDGDGIIDPGEEPVADVVLYLCNSSSPCTSSSGDFIDSVLTDNDGFYAFTDLSNQSYSLTIATPPSYSLTKYSSASTISVVMAGDTVQSIAGQACGECGMDVDFGLTLNGSNKIAGTICVDDGSNDGVCDGTVGEDYLDGIEVYLYRSTGSGYEFFGSAFTNISGNYEFDKLPNGTFVVSIGKDNQYIKISSLTTTDADAPGGDITETANTIYQSNLVLSGSTTINDVDFAFELLPIDLGDLPASYGVTLNSGGPYHVVSSSWKLGANIDSELNGVASKWADSDDNTGSDDDDGITFINAGLWQAGQTRCVSVNYTIPAGETAYLGGWIDWGNDGNFIGDNVVNATLNSGSSPAQFCFTIPNTVNTSSPVQFARFRLFSEPQELLDFAFSGPPQGNTSNGEVEDYALKLMQNSLVTDFGDLPLAYGTAWNLYRDTNENNIPDQLGAVWLGELISNELEQRYNAAAAGESTGDDGILFPSVIDTAGNGQNIFQIIVNASEPGNVYFRFWIDWDMNGSFDSSYAGFGTAASPDTTNVTIYAPDYYQGSFALRLRADDSPVPVNADTAELTNGETEDYVGNIQPLPVDLIEFKAQKLDQSNVLLNWKTASELNNDRFELERLRENEFDFTKIASIKGAGNSNSIRSYDYIDYLGSRVSGNVYYRLKQVDFDGTFSYSPIRFVRFGNEMPGKVHLFPNPTSDRVAIQFTDWPGTKTLKLSDVHGRVLQELELIQGVNQVQLDLSEYAVGVYFIRIQDNTELFSLPVIRKAE